uniref:Putative interferon alpha-inducible protein n=1 Tax=Amblyomma cajennense TaxID=34607 RepID=A0A023FFW1_AMBCJ
MADLFTIGASIAGAAVALVAAPAVLTAAGFGAAGVAGGSLAAAVQSTMGGVVAKGSVFALCQSWGAAGIPVVAKTAVAAAGAYFGYNVAD